MSKISIAIYIKYYFSLLVILLQLLFATNSSSQINYQAKTSFFGKKLLVYEDKTSKLSADLVLKNSFLPVNKDIPNYSLSNSTFWFFISIKNRSSARQLFLQIKNTGITSAELYNVKNDKPILSQYVGESVAFSKKNSEIIYPYFYLDFTRDSIQNYLLKVWSYNSIILPLVLSDEKSMIIQAQSNQNIVIAYFGIISIMLFYNFLIYLSVRDKNYLFYVLYILSIAILQSYLKGYAQKYLLPSHLTPILTATNIAIALSGIFSILFVKSFLQIKTYSLLLEKVLNILLGIYAFCVVLTLLKLLVLAQQLLQITSSISALIVMLSGFKAQKNGFKPAMFFNISWIFFVAGVVVYILKDAGFLKFNSFTDNSILIGSAIEVTLLSLALANKINIYKKEREESQAEALRVSQENETLIREQNVVLEKKVTERTEELRATNGQLNKTLINLKDAQAQLVDAEKMASLGQLTAGIAHEINNPINFVKSNVKPLELDINDLFELIGKYQKLHKVPVGAEDSVLKEIRSFEREIDPDYIKQEVKSLIHGIEEGANRTAEIVQGLRNFSRLDESELKTINIYEGIDSTLLLLKNALPAYIKIFKHYDAPPNVECYPSKLNQVFMNILTNAIQAINAKDKKEQESIIISVKEFNSTSLQICIKDSGIGMTEETKHKVFEPFFTTKDVGEGTGLGMSIVFKIIEKHHAKINIISSLGNGAEFIITLPYTQPVS